MNVEGPTTDREAAVVRLIPEIAWIADADLRQRVVRTWVQAWEIGGWTSIDQCPLFRKADAGVEHVRGVVRLSAGIADLLTEVHGLRIDRDVVLAGSLLHDVGKLLEYAPAAPGKPTGRLLRHPTSGAHLALANGLSAEVAHVVASHSVEGSFADRSLEATIVATADRLDGDVLLRREFNHPIEHVQPLAYLPKR